jgi:hypothetical protein
VRWGWVVMSPAVVQHLCSMHTYKHVRELVPRLRCWIDGNDDGACRLAGMRE